uniref:Uncharacterized protein n=1 Tax=Acrobeloides nanus TaxID=290746 RepID=A0A914DU48_9BILA
MSREACCQFVLLLNDSKKVPFCDFELMKQVSVTQLSNRTIVNVTKLAQVQYTTPVYLTFPSDVPEDHVTFLFGILLLASIAISCTFIILKLTKPKFASVPSGISYTNAPIEYDWMMFMPYQQRRRRSSSLLFLRGMICRSGSSSRRSRRTSFSVVSHSNSSMTTVLPSYRSATGSTISPSTTASIPPPPYEELQTLTASSYSACSEDENTRRDANNNRRPTRIR